MKKKKQIKRRLKSADKKYERNVSTYCKYTCEVARFQALDRLHDSIDTVKDSHVRLEGLANINKKMFQLANTDFSMIFFCPFQSNKPLRAIAVINGPNGVYGNVTFSQNGCGESVLIEVSVIGLSPGEHGFHVHEKGDLSNGCLSTGGHYNPEKVTILPTIQLKNQIN